GDADRAPCAEAALLAVDLDDEVGEAVHDLRLVAEAGRRPDEPEHLHPAVDRVERAELVEDAPQRVEPRRPRRRVALLDGRVLADAAAGPDRPDPGDVREPAMDEHRPELRPERKLRDP